MEKKIFTILHIQKMGPDVFLDIIVFHRRPYQPPQSHGVQLFLKGICTSISKETYSHL